MSIMTQIEWITDYNHNFYFASTLWKRYLLSTTSKLIIIGENFSGKTHLCHFLFHNYAITTIDDIDKRIVSCEQSSMQYFYLPDKIVMTSHTHPSRWNLQITDIKSRFNSVITLDMPILYEEHMQKILIKQLRDFGINMPKHYVHYVCTRLPRSYKKLHEFVLLVHTTCLKEQTKPNIYMLKTLLQYIIDEV